MKKTLFFVFVLLIFAGCGSGDDTNNNDESVDDDQNITWYKPTPNTTWQWQLQNSLNLSYTVDMYDVDLFDTNITTIEKLHNDGKKVICYFSAGSYEEWRDDAGDFPSTVLGNDMDGWEGEKWLDISNIDALKPIMLKRLDLAKEKGCDGVEPDNMDGYLPENNASSTFSITAEDQLIYNKFIANEAHKRGLGIGLKNDLNQIVELEPYYDFAVNEQCNFYDECDMLQPFIDANKPVFNAEYDSSYVENNDTREQLCNTMNNAGFQTLVLPLGLDDSFRYSCNFNDKTFNSFQVGFGGSSSFKFQDNIWVSAVDLMLDSNISSNDNYQQIRDFNATAFSNLQQYLTKAKYFTMWVTKNWEESWYDVSKINEAIQAGKIPVFVYWYFGDTLVNGMPSSSQIDEYKADNTKFKNFLNKINGNKIVIMEPEFNKQAVLNNASDFVSIISDAIDIIDDENTTISLCMTDTGNRGFDETYTKCGYENCALGDKYEWSLSKPIYDALLPKLDFISFQEMLGQFSRDPSNPGTWESPNPIAYTDKQIGIDQLPQRLENMSQYLYELYKKPVFLPYMTIATATWSDENNNSAIDEGEIDKSGYEAKANQVYRDINQTKLQQNHLFGYAIMALFDDPNHDAGGYQYFMENEYHLGVVKSDVNDSQLTGNISFKDRIVEYIFK